MQGFKTAEFEVQWNSGRYDPYFVFNAEDSRAAQWPRYMMCDRRIGFRFLV